MNTPIPDIRRFLKITILPLLALYATLAAGADTMQQYQLAKGEKGYTLQLATVPVPAINADQILVKVHAVSLNRRDIFVLQGSYPGGDASGHVPLSDGAGEVIAVGKNVQGFKAGDRVAGTFFTKWKDGKFSAAALASARGGTENGMLAEMVVATQDDLVRIPAHLSYEEASTLPCAGVTAWNALFKAAHLQKGEYVLLEGTGGVSIFGLQFAAAAGARPIITSSSDDKLAKAKTLGAVGLINYKTKPDWDKEVMALTKNAGVDHILEVGGQDTISKAMATVAFGGHVALIGGLSGFGGNLPSLGLMGRGAGASGIYVGSRADFDAMNAFISKHKIKPAIDKVFPFAETAAAFKYMEESNFLGKIVIKVGS